jgi:two-component system, cell cycle response regulator
MTSETSDPQRSGILIVEDDDSFGAYLERAVNNLGYQVAGRCRDADGAERMAAERHPELVLMDVRLPGPVDGITAAARIREQDIIPVIYLSGFSDIETVERAVRTEPFAYLVKPCRIEELRCAIEVALARHRMEVALREYAQTCLTMSMVDELTGLRNRRAFQLLLEQQVKVAHRTKESFAVLYADLDGLKAINDALGHDAGDAALREVAAILTRAVRDNDVVARLGGDEFAVLAVGASAAAAEQVIHRLESELAAMNAQPDRPFSVAMSVGWVAVDGKSDDGPDAVLARADAAMYERKRARKQTTTPPNVTVG